MIDRLVQDIPDATTGFRLMFSASPSPDYQATFIKVRGEYDGCWYRDDDFNEGWLCPNMFKYFAEAPEKIYARIEAL